MFYLDEFIRFEFTGEVLLEVTIEFGMLLWLLYGFWPCRFKDCLYKFEAEGKSY